MSMKPVHERLRTYARCRLGAQPKPSEAADKMWSSVVIGESNSATNFNENGGRRMKRTLAGHQHIRTRSRSEDEEAQESPERTNMQSDDENPS